uniref:Uncharacterized protein n=1 Tax=Rhizophora mucronata TaxID=61149 RepID=A0A2P2R4Z4_RHIMU
MSSHTSLCSDEIDGSLHANKGLNL